MTGTRATSIEVVAAVIQDGSRYLLTRRQPGVHLAGLWEFPGGKVQPDESHETALRRELLEELAVESVVEAFVLSTSHRYPERSVTLHFYRCRLEGEPSPQQEQEMRWVERHELPTLEFPDADADLIRVLLHS